MAETTLHARCGRRRGRPGGGAAYAAVRSAPPPTPPVNAAESATQAEVEFAAWTHKLPLPPGASWKALDMPTEGVVFGGNTGVQAAIDQAIGAWARECISAQAAGDSQRVKNAIAALSQIRAVMPEWKEGMKPEPGRLRRRHPGRARYRYRRRVRGKRRSARDVCRLGLTAELRSRPPAARPGAREHVVRAQGQSVD